MTLGRRIVIPGERSRDDSHGTVGYCHQIEVLGPLIDGTVGFRHAAEIVFQVLQTWDLWRLLVLKTRLVCSSFEPGLVYTGGCGSKIGTQNGLPWVDGTKD